LGIETSCDDTAVAIVEDGHRILSEVVANQDEYHRKYGGVVPEIAARKHIEHILPSIQHCLLKASISPLDLTAIAVTHRPGLIGSLIVGLTAAKTMALYFGKPLIGINHIEAHAYTGCFAGLEYASSHITLVASGGHTSLLRFSGSSMELIGWTVDDAAGEAYDKVSKLMGLGYPGGPIIDKLALNGDPNIVKFPRPMVGKNNFNFSFSGLKTAVLYYKHKHPDSTNQDIAAAFQDAAVDVLVKKTLSAAKHFKLSSICVTGGVASNSALRHHFTEMCRINRIKLYIPHPRLCTDNAVMVAGLAFHKWLKNDQSDLTLGACSDAGISNN